MKYFKLIRYISLVKLYNILLAYFCYFLSSILKRVIVWNFPFSLTTEPTNRCNFNCLECPTGNKSSNVEKGEMLFEDYKKIIDQVKKYITYQMIYFQGEPFLNKEIYRMIKYSDDNKIFTSTSTNGHFLTQLNCKQIVKSGLKKIIISLDGASQASYEKYRIGGNLNTVINGIKNLVEAKEELDSAYPQIVVQFLVFNHNEHEIPNIKHLCKNLGIDKLEFKTAQISSKQNFNLVPKNKKYSRYSLTDSKYVIKKKLNNRCFRIWSILVITWNGTVIPCCFDKNNNHKIGNIIDTNTLKPWSSETYNRFRLNVLKHRSNYEICCNCNE
jgi:radical SAM protein with 4Fe4S-binding SPASM domain